MNTAKTGKLLIGKTDINGRAGIPAIQPDGSPIKLGGGEIILNEKSSTKHCKQISDWSEEDGGIKFDCELQKVANTDRATGRMPKDEYHQESAATGKQINKTTKHEIESIISGKSKVRNGDAIQAAFIYLRGNEGASPTSGKTKPEFEEEKLTKYISDNNLWYTGNLDEGNYLGRGMEQLVYKDKDFVIKTNNAIFYDFYWTKYFTNLLLHNYFFYDTPYELIGFTRSTRGKLMSVVRQPFVEQNPPVLTNLNDVEKFMRESGFARQHRLMNVYENKDLGIIIGDLHDGNVLTKNDLLYFIDTKFFMETQSAASGAHIDAIASYATITKKERMIRLAKAGCSRREIMSKVGANAGEVYNILKKAGVNAPLGATPSSDWEAAKKQLFPHLAASGAHIVDERTCYNEATRYISNAREALQKSSVNKYGYYEDVKYVKSAAGIAYAGVEMAAKWFLKIKGVTVKGKGIEHIKDALAKIDKRMLQVINYVYNGLHIDYYYGNSTKESTMKDLLKESQRFIDYLKPYNQMAHYASGTHIPNRTTVHAQLMARIRMAMTDAALSNVEKEMNEALAAGTITEVEAGILREKIKQKDSHSAAGGYKRVGQTFSGKPILEYEYEQIVTAGKEAGLAVKREAGDSVQNYNDNTFMAIKHAVAKFHKGGINDTSDSIPTEIYDAVRREQRGGSASSGARITYRFAPTDTHAHAIVLEDGTELKYLSQEGIDEFKIKYPKVKFTIK